MSNNFEDYLCKSQESLDAARTLLDAGYYNSCVSRCYYAMFQMTIAALMKYGVKPPKENEFGHDWVQS